MKKTLILTYVIIVFTGCSKNYDQENPDGLSIRLANRSPYYFKNIKMNTSTGNVSFGNLDAGKYSEYEEFERAYRYAYVELEIGNSTYTLQPIDFAGETPLKNGKYTFEINALDSEDRSKRLTLRLVED